MNNFTPRAQQVLALARKEADRFNHNYVGSEHLLLGLVRLGQGVAVNVLQKLGLDIEILRIEVEKQVGHGPDTRMSGNIPYTPRVKKVLALAAKEAKALNHSYVGTEHILLGLLREGDGVAARVLKILGVDLERTRDEIIKELDPNFIAGASHPISQEINRIKKELTSPEDQKSGIEQEIAAIRSSNNNVTGTGASDLLSRLGPGERLLWSGVPTRKFRFERRHLPLFFFLLPLFAFLLIPLSAAFDSEAPDQTKRGAAETQLLVADQAKAPPTHKATTAEKVFEFLFGALFITGFFGVIVTSMGVNLPGGGGRLKTTVYGITNLRLIVIAGKKRKTVRSFHLGSLSDIRLEEWPDGLGTISFGARLNWPYGNSFTDNNPALENIAEPANVFSIIAQLRKTP